MLLLQFSTSHYCRKARLALGYKQLSYRTQNLTPGLHALQLKPLTGLTTVPVLQPEREGEPAAIADSTHIFHYLERIAPLPSLIPADRDRAAEAWLLEDWLDESIGTATRFVYYHYRAGAGKAIDPSFASQTVIRVVRWQYGINPATVQLATARLTLALAELTRRWSTQPFLVAGDRPSVADIAAAALLSPLALLPPYRQSHPLIFDRIRHLHTLCQEPLPPGLEASAAKAAERD